MMQNGMESEERRPGLETTVLARVEDAFLLLEACMGIYSGSVEQYNEYTRDHGNHP